MPTVGCLGLQSPYTAAASTLFDTGCNAVYSGDNQASLFNTSTGLDYGTCMDSCANESLCVGVNYYSPTGQTTYCFLFKLPPGGGVPKFAYFGPQDYHSGVKTTNVDTCGANSTALCSGLPNPFVSASGKPFYVDCVNSYFNGVALYGNFAATTFAECMNGCAADSRCVAVDWGVLELRCYTYNSGAGTLYGLVDARFVSGTIIQ